jgi:hypothetical protein
MAGRADVEALDQRIRRRPTPSDGVVGKESFSNLAAHHDQPAATNVMIEYS